MQNSFTAIGPVVSELWQIEPALLSALASGRSLPFRSVGVTVSESWGLPEFEAPATPQASALPKVRA